MNKLITFCFILITKLTFCQTEKYLDKLIVTDDLDSLNYIKKFNKYDFSKVWLKTESRNIYGIIGENHQRIKVKLISITKSSQDDNEYFVKGKTKVKNNICDFSGKITLKEVFILNKFDYGVDNWAKGKIENQGVLICDYVFKENEHKKYTGIFKGKLFTKWVIKKSGNQIEYDNIRDDSDGYRNNSFIGNWTSYKTNKTKVCNWGDHRVPNTNADFDIGACCFFPNKKYHKFGWKEFVDSLEERDKEISLANQERWWK